MVATLDEAVSRLEILRETIASVIRGKDLVIRRVVGALLCRGHVLVEDVPGVGKTTLTQALARCLDLSFQRVQFTSDTLPSDILGISVYREAVADFEFRPGPIFANVVLADEINRATPKTQSALLEGMNERAVTVEGRRLDLPEPFLVLATQNPVESVGTYPLPESQLDRFLFRITIGYPDAASERALLRGEGGAARLAGLEPVLTAAEVTSLQQRVDAVRVDDRVLDYEMEIVRRTRESPLLRLGASPRAAQGLYRAAQAEALLDARSFVVPDDVKAVAVETLAHRVLVAEPGAELRALRSILEETPVPR